MSGKLLMFAKLSLKSFIYELTKTLCFPNETVTKFFDKYLIEKVESFHALMETDSTSLQFVFISHPNSEIEKAKFRDIIFEVITSTNIYDRFADSSHEFWDLFNTRKKNIHKDLRLYEIENINNPCVVTLAVNPKEYIEIFKDRNFKKKLKGITKGFSGLEYENYAERIKSLVNFDTFEKPQSNAKKSIETYS